MPRTNLKIGLMAGPVNQGTGPATYLETLKSALAGKHILSFSAPGCPADADLIHIADAKRVPLEDIDACRVPVIADFHDDYWTNFTPYPAPDLPLRWLRQKQLRRHHLEVIRRSRAVIVHSRSVAESIKNSVPAGPPPVHIVPYGISRIPAEENPPAPSPNLILLVGRDIFRKGFSTLSKALPEVLAKLPGARLAVIGDEYKHTLLAARFLSRGLPAEFIPRLDPAELDRWYNRAGVLVLPSHQEAFGIVLLEAMARGLPVAAANVGGIPEAIEDNLSGLLHRPGDHHDLAEKIVSALTDSNLREKLITGGRERAAAFSLERMAGSLEAVYQSVMEAAS